MTGRTRAVATAVCAAMVAVTTALAAGSPASANPTSTRQRAAGGVVPTYERTIGTLGKPIIGPSGIDVDNTGKLYVADTANSQVAAYDALGNQLWRVGTLGATGPGNFSNPRDVAVDSAKGLLFVADTAFNRVQVLNATNGASMSVWPEKFTAAMGIHVGVDAHGNTIVLVADATNNHIDLFTETGTALGTVGATSGSGKLDQPRDAATDAHGNIYVADFKNNRVVVFSPTGTFVRAWGGWAGTTPPANGKFRDPYGIDLDDMGRVYVSDNLRIQEFTETGTYIQSYGTQGTGPQQFFQLRRVSVGSGANPYIYGADLWGFKVLRFTYTGTFSLEYGKGATPPLGTLNQAYGMTMGPQGQSCGASSGCLYIADTNNQRMQEFDPVAGTALLQFGHRGFGSDLYGFNWPRDLVYMASTNTLWVADTKNFRLLNFSLNGTSTGHHLGSQGSGNGQLAWVFALAASGSDIVVADTTNDRVQLWDPSNTTSPVVWTYNTTNKSQPKALAVANGDVYVADTTNNQIVVLNATTGALVSTLAAGKIMDPEGIAVTPLGNIWVSSSSSDTLTELDPSGNVLETYGSMGSGKGTFDHPSHLLLTTGTTEELYVMDVDNGGCQVFSVTGS